MPLNKEINTILRIALKEDIGPRDVTTAFSVPKDTQGKVIIIAREHGIMCGGEMVRAAMHMIDKTLSVKIIKKDGEMISRDDLVIEISGSLAAILAAERVAVNFLSLLSGVATATWHYVKKIEDTNVKILDTRKTTPGLRLIEKYAVRMGKGTNHRVGLYDGIIIKDNHLRAGKMLRGSHICSERLEEVIFGMRAKLKMPIEVEVETLAEFDMVAHQNPDVIMLDNFNVKTIRKAVKIRNKKFPKIKLEASGGVNMKNVRAIALTGVDFISIGSITHSPKSFDFSLEIASVD